MKQAYIYINYPNVVVLKSYLEVVRGALVSNGYQCEFVTSLDGVDKKSLIVHPMAIDAFKYYFKGFRNYILWQQGATADESYMRNHSNLRYWLLNKIDVFSMRKAKFILFVSEYMRNHYEELAKTFFKSKSYIMPCFNEQYDESVYEQKDYSKKVFTYVGSLDLWQCFEETVDLYKQIESRIPGTSFKVLTFSVDKATDILKEKKIRNFEVRCVPKEEVKAQLIEATYGFIIREDNMVNRVATPTKFSSYLAAGVIPIFSECLNDFSLASAGMKNVLKLSERYNIEDVVNFVEADKDAESIKHEYYKLLSGHYSPTAHVINITRLLNVI